ncbi:MAG: hypothetical protein KAT70_09625, partial [Thermoplasmata archaeon]|nr:hypothetical protein [Thermoplasmata archaeon]
SLEGSGLDLEMPKVEVSGKPAFVVTQTIEGGLSIKMLDASEEFDIDDYESEAAGRNLVILLKTQNFEQDKITILDDTPTGLAKVSRVYLPLINWPQGTEGYVYPIQLDEEGSYYVPLITGSDIRNREEISNPHSVQYTSLLPLDYTVMSCRAFECLCLKEDFINNGSLLWGE